MPQKIRKYGSLKPGSASMHDNRTLGVKTIFTGCFWRCFLILFMGVSQLSLEAGQVEQPVNGVLDLSRSDWRQQNFTLSGDWEFYWQQYISWQQFAQPLKPLTPAFFPVPGVWNSSLLHTGSDGLGYATYRLKIVLPPGSDKSRLLGLKIGEIATSYLLWADHKLIAANGCPGISRESTIPRLKPQTVVFVPGTDTLNLVLMAANFHYRVGGLIEPLKIGNAENILHYDQFNLSREVFLAGTLLMIGLYHFTIFFFRRKERSSFWFALVCLTMTVRTLLVGENFICRYLPQLDWEWQNKLEYLTFYLTIPFFIHFIYSIYPEEMLKGINKIFYGLSGFYIVITLFFPARVYSILNLAFQAMVILVIVYLFYVLVRALLKKEFGVILLLAGFVVLGTSTVNDILYSRQLIETFPMATYGTFIFLFSQAILLSRRYSKAFVSVEELSERLIASYQELKDSQEVIVKQEKLASLGTMTAGIAHEINNPAQAIKFSMSGLELNIQDLEKLITELKKILALPESERMQYWQDLPDMLASLDLETVLAEIRNTVQENLGAVKRIEHIVQSTKKYAYSDNSVSQCDLNEIIEDALILVLNQIKHDVHLKTILAPGLPLFPGSAQEISQIIINLLTNARDAIKEKGLSAAEGFIEITTEFDALHNMVILKVQDNGCGISKRHLTKIYDPFFTTKPIGKGTGLGLNIVYKMITKHEGKIQVSTQKNIGTLFTISFPVDRQIILQKSFSTSESGEPHI